MVLVAVLVVTIVVARRVVGTFAHRSTTLQGDAAGGARTGASDPAQAHPGWVVRIPRAAGFYAWMEHGAVARDGRYFVDGWEVVFADPEPDEPPLAAYRETSAAASRAVRSQEAARNAALARRSEYLGPWAA